MPFEEERRNGMVSCIEQPQSVIYVVDTPQTLH
uniref:Uncharacterized protein n=1 Tax=Arundo donax TaxID=35708 RepID=A0A0A9B1U0_ARUDO